MDVTDLGLDYGLDLPESFAGIGIYTLFIGLEYPVEFRGRACHLAEYRMEIPFPASDNCFGCRGWIVDQWLADADRFQEPLGRAIRLRYQFRGKFRSGFRGLAQW